MNLPSDCGITKEDIRQDAAEVTVARCNDWLAGYRPPSGVSFVNWIFPRCLGDLKDKYKTIRRRLTRDDPVVLMGGGMDDLAYTPGTVGGNPALTVAMELLPDAQRQAIEATYFRGLTQAEYGKEVGITQTAVAQLCQRAIRSLRVLLSE